MWSISVRKKEKVTEFYPNKGRKNLESTKRKGESCRGGTSGKEKSSTITLNGMCTRGGGNKQGEVRMAEYLQTRRKKGNSQSRP